MIRSPLALCLGLWLTAGCSLTLDLSSVQGGEAGEAAGVGGAGGMGAAGCTVSLSSDRQNCGVCGHQCGASARCAQGVCQRTITSDDSPPRRLAVDDTVSPYTLYYTVPTSGPTDGMLRKVVDDGSSPIASQAAASGVFRHVMSSQKGNYVVEVIDASTRVHRLGADGSTTCLLDSDGSTSRLGQSFEYVYVPSNSGMVAISKSDPTTSCQAVKQTLFETDAASAFQFTDIAVGSRTVMWAAGTSKGFPGGIYSCPIEGCTTPTEVLRNGLTPTAIVVFEDVFYWVMNQTEGEQYADIYRMADKAGAQHPRIGKVNGLVDRLLVVGSQVFVSTAGAIQRGILPAGDGGAEMVFTTLIPATMPFSIELGSGALSNQKTVYWVERSAANGPKGGLRAFDLTGLP